MSDSVIEIPGNLDKHFRCNGATPHSKRKYKGVDIFLADGGPHYDAALKDNLDPRDEWMKGGYYVTTWAITKGRRIFGRPLYFAPGHDPALTPDAKLKARIRAAFKEAVSMIDHLYEAGDYGIH